ncbi:MAG: IS982 family transposase [Alphaproteobacteria bacterium]|nr:IS982 family transposase [Alphaproteobacteria bacterium]
MRLNRGVQASFGYCAAKDQKYFGFKGHLVMHISGLILSYEMAAANIDERDVLPELTHNYKGLMIADKDLLRPSLKEELRDHGLDLQTPLRDNMVDTRPKEWVQQIISLRRTIETVISQLADRFQIQPIKAKDLWHLSAKAGRKILAHTCCFFTVNSLQFDAITS